MGLDGTFSGYFGSPRRLGQPIFAPEVTRAVEHGKKMCVNFKLGRCEKRNVATMALWPIPVGSPTEASFEPRAGNNARKDARF
jgi:hypothetical protein